MAKQTRKQVPAKPVTTHPLFPAVIALWFGALFGLGSLAVRPSLLESLVISSRIDLIVPAAAPPLGITARILVALVLAAIGAGIGIALARRLTRPKLEQRERKRGAGSVVEDSDKLHSGHHYADAAMRAPLSVSEDLNTELAHEDRSQGAGGMAPRRRSLAIEHEEIDFVPHDLAPLPGGVPQILDIGEVRISNEAAEAPLDLSAFSAAIAPDPAPAEPAQYSATPANPVQLDWNNAAPVRPAPGAEPQAPRQVFQSFDEAPTAQSADFDQHQQDMALEIAEAAAAGRQVFGMEPPAQSAEPTRQIFGQAITGDQIDPEFIKAAGFKTSVFDVETPSPLFAPREADHASAATTDSFSVPPAPVIQAYQVPEAYVPPSQLVTSTDTAEAPAKVELVTKPVAQPAPILPSPSGLGMDDLAARLADSMARRRAARSGQLAEEPIETAPAPIQTGTEPAPQVTPVEMARAAEFMAAASEPATESVIGTPAIPAAYVPPISAEPLAPPPPFAAPVQTTFAAEPETEPASLAAAIPQAMRPLDLGGFEEDHAPLDSILPPRIMAMPAALSEAVPVAEPTPAPFAAPTDEAEIANEGVAEESYGSLLGVSPVAAPKPGFVRIEEPEAENAASEPVVIFPGQMARPVTAGSNDDAGSFRRFDAPASAGQGQPIAANQALSDVDSEEAQRALRSALANLQRMSGAA